MGKSAKLIAAELPPDKLRAWLEAQPQWVLDEIEREEWWWVRRPEQAPPPGNWFVWLILSGRGWGKTRTGAEWIVEQALAHPRDATGHPTQWLVVGETLADVRTLCIDGPSGIRAVLTRRGIRYRYVKAPQITIELPDRQTIYFEGADNEDTGRGYNLAGAWLDELAKWRYSYAIWHEGLMLSLRAQLPNGGRPRAVVTTTPKPIKLLKEWVKRARAGDPFIHLTTGSTYENAPNLSEAAIAEFRREYEGTTVGRQELYGELLDEVEGALWTHALIERCRVKPSAVPEMRMVVVGMDPPGTGTGDECGIVVVGRGVNDEDYVLADRSAKVAGRAAARRAWDAVLEYNANWLIVEDNLGRAWLEQVLTDAYREMQREGLFPPGGSAPLRMVTATQGKRLRAEPTAMRYEQGRVHHVGTFPELEDQMASWVPEDQRDSPDRVDALVHAQAFLRGREKGRSRLAVPGTGAMPVASPF